MTDSFSMRANVGATPLEGRAAYVVAMAVLQSDLYEHGDEELRESVRILVSKGTPEDPEKAVRELVEAAQEFVRKVDEGEAHSVRSYAQFRAALAPFEEPE
jgi:hypothetical protein